tara:strand:+ start:36034 stop:36264 length:231 start_codon:yes stop_codon:yes gene_type:complete
MKKLLFSAILLLAISFSFTSCRDTKKSETIKDAVENASEATEGALEQTGKAIDNAVEQTKEAGEATKKAIEKVGGN